MYELTDMNTYKLDLVSAERQLTWLLFSFWLSDSLFHVPFSGLDAMLLSFYTSKQS